MSDKVDNDIVIECSPYGDSETEIMNLKNPSYEIISMPDIFEYEKSLSVFIYVVSALGLVGLFVFLIFRMKSNTTYSKDDIKNIAPYIYYPLLFVLFFIGIFAAIPYKEEQNFRAIIISFFIIIIILALIEIYEKKNKIHSFLPLSSVYSDYGTGIAMFVFLWIILYILISLLRMIDNTDEPFSPILLLSSYCLLKILDYIYKNYLKNNTLYNDSVLNNNFSETVISAMHDT